MSGEDLAKRRIPTPCLSICKLDPFADSCIGCFRTIDEIARWAEMTQEERQVVMAQLSVRRAAAQKKR